jgi:uncharacterized protein
MNKYYIAFSKLMKRTFFYLFPDYYNDNILDIDFDSFYRTGLRLLLIDIDNTIVEREQAYPEWKMKKLISDLNEKNWKIILLSNNRNINRAVKVADFLDVDCFFKSLKPFPWIYKKILKEYNYLPEETLCIGDQLFMDILGGNIMHCNTIYVSPLGGEPNIFRALYILFERIIIRTLKKLKPKQVDVLE